MPPPAPDTAAANAARNIALQMHQERGRGAVLVGGVARVDAALEHLLQGAFRCGCSPNQPWTNNWTKLPTRLEPSMHTVNVHEAKTHFSRLIDAAHAGETILVAKDGKPWARLVPLENGSTPQATSCSPDGPIPPP